MKTLMRILIAAMVLFTYGFASAGQTTGRIGVSVTVLPVMEKNLVYQASSVIVTERDIKMGYVDVNDATVIEVTTNSRNGYILAFESAATPFKEIWVIDGGRSTVLSTNGGFVYQGSSGTWLIKETKVLSYRFYLAKDTRAQTYTWPMAMDVIMD